MPIPKYALEALLSAIREEGPHVFASPENADYFRKNFRRVEPTIPQEKPSFKAPTPEPEKREPVSPPPPVVKIEKSAEPPPKPILPKPVVNFSAVRNVLSVVAPELAILNEIPNDALAKKLSERWKTKNQTAPLSVLVYQENAEQRAFLEEIAKALDVYFGPAKIVHAEEIEKEKQWETFLSVEGLKLVIVCDYTLWQMSHLMRFYKEIPNSGVRVLGNTPLFLLPDLSLYLKDAHLKRSLWKALCQKCS